MAPVTKHGDGAVEACAGEASYVSVERVVADILQDDQVHAKEDRSSSRRGRRRALLIGIRYEQVEQWDTLDKTHEDVDTFRRLLLGMFHQFYRSLSMSTLFITMIRSLRISRRGHDCHEGRCQGFLGAGADASEYRELTIMICLLLIFTISD